VIVATRDADLRPEITRAWGVRLDGDVLEVCVQAPPGSPTHAALVPGAQVAVSACRPTTYESVQLKGAVTRVAASDAAELARAEAGRDAFIAEAIQVGVLPHLAPRFYDGDALVAVTVAIAARYDQTPGPDAGGPL
jgi:hypothetical protein